MCHSSIDFLKFIVLLGIAFILTPNLILR
jgi:hypothetical protein